MLQKSIIININTQIIGHPSGFFLFFFFFVWLEHRRGLKGRDRGEKKRSVLALIHYEYPVQETYFPRWEHSYSWNGSLNSTTVSNLRNEIQSLCLPSVFLPVRFCWQGKQLWDNKQHAANLASRLGAVNLRVLDFPSRFKGTCSYLGGRLHRKW